MATTQTLAEIQSYLMRKVNSVTILCSTHLLPTNMCAIIVLWKWHLFLMKVVVWQTTHSWLRLRPTSFFSHNSLPRRSNSSLKHISSLLTTLTLNMMRHSLAFVQMQMMHTTISLVLLMAMATISTRWNSILWHGRLKAQLPLGVHLTLQHARATRVLWVAYQPMV